jgi:branched-chain amino acid transport system ATP-binding protein
VCDRVLVLDYGKKIAEGSAADAEGSGGDAAYLGGEILLNSKVRRAPPSGRNALLELTRVEIAYGGIHAVKGIDLHVDKGELVCLIGTNGAGKTTTLKGITGLQPVKDGAIKYAGENVTGRPAFELVRKGLAMVPEGRGVFGALTIEENLAMGAYIRNDRAAVREDIERVFALFPRLKERRRQTAGTLSGGEQQMLAMGRALMSKPKLLLLDEPSMGLAPLMVQKVFETVLKVSGEGVTILLIEQNAKLALEVSHRGYVMESGEITLSGDAKTLLHDPAVRAAYLGEGA